MGGSLTLVFIKQLDYIRTWQKSFLTLDVNVGRLCLDFDMLRLCRWRNCTIGCDERLSALSGEGVLLCALEASATGTHVPQLWLVWSEVLALGLLGQQYGKMVKAQCRGIMLLKT